MSVHSWTAAKELKKELMYKSRDIFQDKCYAILKELFPNLNNARALGEVDTKGIDIFTIDDQFDKMDTVFQIKGFETADFGESQLKQCKHSIKSFIDSGIKVREYYFIINRYNKGKYFGKLIPLIDILKKNRQVKECHLFDINNFIEFIVENIRDKIFDNIIDTNKRFISDFNSAMDQKFYYENVPFEVNNEKKNNPTIYFNQRSRPEKDNPQNHKARYIKGKYFFIISEFGFGKTSFLLNLLHSLNKKKRYGIFLPAALLERNSFSNTLSFCYDVLDIITSEKCNRKESLIKLKARILSNILDTDPNVILIIDGLDEHAFLNKEVNVRRLFNSLSDFKSVVVFSMRKSYWEDRNSTFKLAVGSHRQFQDRIILDEWNNENIIEYLLQFLNLNKLSPTQKLNIEKFIKLIELNQYENFYGDIPKRPLFLEMLINDINEGNIKKRNNISELYEKYLISKFNRDLAGQFSTFVVDREFSLEDAQEKILEKIFDILDHAASQMLLVDEQSGEFLLMNTLPEIEIESILKEKGFRNILEFLLHSVLVSNGKREMYRFNLRFAHKSFQEFFTARYLLKLIQKDKLNDYEEHLLNGLFNASIIEFILGLIELRTLKSEIKIKLHAILRNRFDHAGKNSLILKLYDSLNN